MNHFLISLVPLVLFTIFLYKWIIKPQPKSSKISPPSPPKLPIIGNLHQLGKYPHRSLQQLSRKYGPLMMIHLGKVPVIVASSADAAREIMKTHDLIFSNRPKTGFPDKLFYGSKDIAFAPYGEYWRQIRSLSVLQLLSNKRVQSFRHVREEETSLMIYKIEQKLCLRDDHDSSALINLTDSFAQLTNDILCRVALGRKYSDGGEKTKEFKALLMDFGNLLGTFNVEDYVPWLGWVNNLNGLNAKVERVFKKFDEFVEGVIKDHLAKRCKYEAAGDVVNGDDIFSADRDEGNGELQNVREARGSDFVDILLEVQKENLAGFSLEFDSIKALIMEMFAAGTDTTHTVLEWAMTELLRHPRTLRKLESEVREIGRGKSEINEDDLPKMRYLNAVIKETLRLHVPVPLLVPRVSTKDVTIMGFHVAAGTQVYVNAWAIGRDPSLWENPEEFFPERFLAQSEVSEIDFRGHNFELIPFGAGRRGCPGITFGVAVNELTLAKLVHKFQFKLPKGAEVDVAESNGITVHKKSPLFALATPY